MSAASWRIVQVSDSHVAAAAGAPPQWRRLVEWLDAEPPDLVVHTGDIVYVDPDDDDDRALAVSLLAQVPVPRVVIPGNHDVGFYDEPDALPRRLAAFVAAYGSDRFAVDLGEWRLVGVDAYLLGRGDELGRAHDAWFAAAVPTDRPSVVFVHQPPLGDVADGWQMPAAPRAAFAAATVDRPVALIASGHRHCGAQVTLAGRRTAWAPSLTLRSESSLEWLSSHGASGVTTRSGVAELTLHPGGLVEHRCIEL